MMHLMQNAEGLKTRTAVEQARIFVRESLKKNGWKKGDCLPSIRSLALHARVSPRTMIKAVALLKNEGAIYGGERARLKVGPEGGLTAIRPSQESDTPVWLMKRAALEKDLLEGAFARDEKLPSIKELCTRYGACFVTMRKALRSMVADHVVQLYRGRYTLPQIRSRPFQQRLVFISFRIQAVQWSALNQGQYRVLDLLETECVRRQLKLEVVEVNFEDSTDTRRAIGSQTINAPALGYFFDVWWFDNKEHIRGHLDLLTHLAKLNRPVAMLDENGNFDLPGQFANNPLLQVFRIEGQRAGARVARMLLELGHRSVVFISWQHSQRYSTQRLAGIREQFAVAGQPDTVRTVLNDTMDEFFKFLAISGFGEKLIRRILAIDRTEKQADELYRLFQQYRRADRPLLFDLRQVPVLQKKIRCIADLFNTDIDKRYFDQMVRAAVFETTEEFSRLICQGLCRQALRHADATAWICANDGIAGIALQYLRGVGIPVPRRLSIVGFDNAPVAALEQRLTTFDFNAAGFAHRMLSFIARTPRPKGVHRHAVIEVEGMIMRRGTTGPAPERGEVAAWRKDLVPAGS
jgi:DNA-binding LacI/PurR family transcriptional regulator/DNA-binding transcriptional regulator YhcF (GntR family)